MFKLKLKVFINDILKKKMFDKFFLIFLNKFSHNKSFKDTLIKQLIQITVFKSVFNIV